MARGEASISVFGGFSWSPDSDVTIRQSGGTDLTQSGVGWKSQPFEAPIYGGARMLLWLPRLPEAGFGLDYTHVKALSDPAQVVSVSGNRQGSVVGGFEPAGATVRGLAISNHVLLLMMQKRWFKDLFQPYVGLGMGVSLPNISGSVGSVAVDTTRFGGLAFGALAGVSEPLYGPVGGFVEYKVIRTRLDVPVGPGTQLTSTLWAHQVAFGISVSFGNVDRLESPQ